MKRKLVLTALIATLTLSSAAARAGDAEKVIGGIILGTVGALIISNERKKQAEQQRQQQERAVAVQQQQQKRNVQNNAQRNRNREVQSALNAFDFNAGVEDGILGPRSRGAISDFQSAMGYPATGRLDEVQRQRLLQFHEQMQNGAVAAYPEVFRNEGPKGLLKAMDDPDYARKYDKPTLPPQKAPVGDVTRNADAGNSGGAISIPGFQKPEVAATSMSGHCELVAGMTQVRQGAILSGDVSDAEQALGEQFCEARGFAMTRSQGILENAGQSASVFSGICEQVADRMAPAIADIPSGDVKLVAQQAQQAALVAFNNDMEKATTVGQICLGLGYRKDDAAIVLGAATTLLGAGKLAYAEVLGHHARWGFGTPATAEASTEWYDTALSSMEQGAEPAFLPSKTAERNAIIRAAIAGELGNKVVDARNGSQALDIPTIKLGDN